MSVRARWANWTRIGMAVSGAVLLAGCTSGSGPDSAGNEPTTTTAGAPAALDMQTGFVQVVHDVLPSVVQITTGKGLGSGVVYDDKGHIVTNAHVVGQATTFEVTFATGGKPMRASLVASYPPDDLAVIKVDGKLPVPPATLGDSSALQVGQLVLAMGNPLGLSSSVSNGIVSAVGRTVTEPKSEESPGTTIADMIQTSAAINPGNSGGALVDMDRQVVGIPTLAATDPQLGGGAAPGIGFAIPSNTVKRIADQIIRDGKVTDSGRAALGILARTVVDPDGAPAGVGVVRPQPGSPAAKAGIEAGDVITKVDDTPVPALPALNKVLVSHKPGQAVKVTVLRDGRDTTLTVTLGEQ